MAAGHGRGPIVSAKDANIVKKPVCFLWLFLAFAPGAAAQSKFQPAVLYDIGGKFDKSLNEGIATGIASFAEKSGVEFREFEVTNDTQREQALRNMARRGDSPIIVAGPSQAQALAKVAQEFPRTRFAIVDAVVKLPNVQSIIFRDHEGAFLVGALAALASESGTIGFIGGADIPRVRRVACGYVQGARYVNKKITVLQNMAGTGPAAWNDPIRGAELAQAQFDGGGDVVFHLAGGTGLGVLQAATEAGKLAIGNEFNQNALHPGSVLTSMRRWVDTATFNMFKTAAQGTWKPGILSLGLREGGISWTLDDHNAPLVNAQMRDAMGRIRTAIVNGTIKIADYAATGECPV